MPKAGRLRLEPMTNNSARKQTFDKRKRGFIKKINELTTLCGVKACAVINYCDNTEPEFWPSREGAEAVHSEFMNVGETQRSKKMYDQKRYLSERIHREEEKVRKLEAENREMELREVMFDLLKGKSMSPHHYYDQDFMEELHLLIDGYVNRLAHRTEFLEEASGESVPPNVAVTDASGPVVVGTEGLVSNPTEDYNHMRQYDGMDMSMNEQAPGGSNDHVHHQNMNHHEPFQYQTHGNVYDQTHPRFYGSSQGMNVNHQEPFHYQPPGNSYDHTQPKFYGSSQTGMNVNHQEPFQYQTASNFNDQTQPMVHGSSQGMNVNHQEPFPYQTPGNIYDQTQPRLYGSSQGMHHDQGQSSNQYPNSNQSFMSMLMGQPQQMSYVQEPLNVASMDDNNNCYQHLPFTSQMPTATATTTTAAVAADLSGHGINNKGWPTRFGLD